MSVNWKNVIERVVSTTVQAAVGAAAASAEAVATGALDWRTGLTGVAVAALIAFAKNLQVELATPNEPNATLAPNDDVRASLTRKS
jgi:hypothetical protein